MKLTQLTQLPEEAVSHNPEIRKRVMLRSGDLPYLTNFSQARFAPGQVATAHAHTDMYEVFLVESGSGTIRIDQQPYPLTPGVCVAAEPGEVHEVSNTGQEVLVLTYFGIQTST
ncbi:cupin domain-containing protein [Romeria aff. gracilis LEGE 07310]|uniref:Cupin domain-containing protein n=1 Tax=Vasconcelosia minhoensis LEGE 07310 TaxID=915328 RepID=A0A8J7AFA2_9CYAN|nr:cupin domain-containing protein [Romeria gracilis]MBE9076408.1 cupin domain-containing protein [Romeria aff. gracilis LEGE 07310]